MLFDEGIDRVERLELGLKNWVKIVRERAPGWLTLLVNKRPEFRDDKQFLPLQASDLLAWNLRRYCERPAVHAVDPVWTALREGGRPNVHLYTEQDFIRLLHRIREGTWRRVDEGLRQG